MPDIDHLDAVRDHLVDAGKHLRMALSAFDPEMVAEAGMKGDWKTGYAGHERELRAVLIHAQDAYRRIGRLQKQDPEYVGD